MAEREYSEEYTHSDEYKRVAEAIAQLEAQRAALGDAVVDVSIAALQEKLAALEPVPLPEQRKQVTVLFADVSGFTAMSETLDAEEVSDVMNALWQRIDVAIVKHGGSIDKHLGDAVMALWGVETARERDPEQAVRAALDMQAVLAEFEGGPTIRMRIGLSTGPVLLGWVGTTGEFSAIGDAVNLASRMEAAAPAGGVLISHDTYRHVRGVFDVLEQEPLQVKGKARPVRAYLVQQAKPRAFRMSTRGVAGVETRMVGRDAELLMLQNLFRDATEDAEAHVVTVLGEAGVGKSRLQYEFEKWIEELPEKVRRFEGRATLETETRPYGLIRRMFAFRFEILASDSAAVVREKFRAGMAPSLSSDQADLVGQLLGLDFSASHAVQARLGSESFGELATAHLAEYLQAAAAGPTVITLEDIHWSDDSSLDLIDNLVAALPGARLLVVCLARPGLFERRPSWGVGREVHTRIDLKPLSRRASRVLVGEILQKTGGVPHELRDLIVDGAEGNPFYVEELIKMLMEDGVIVRGDCSQDHWRIEMERLAKVQVPPTLIGVLQARLDSLPRKEKELLQRAAVVGRLFWDTAVAELEATEGSGLSVEEIGSLLDAACDRELIFRRERSAFAGAKEYIFKHTLLREVTYKTVLLNLRRVYHGQAARWLERSAGKRIGEYLGLVAGHYELAGEAEKAVEYLLQAGDKARLAYACQEASGYYNRALPLLEEQGKLDQMARTLMKLGLTYDLSFDFQASRQAYEWGFALWQRAGEIEPAMAPPPAPHALRVPRLDPPTLDPTIAAGTTSGAVISPLFSGLVELSPEMSAVPEVAQSWEVLEGGCKYIFHLREDVRWTDGTPVTAGDFEYAWKRVLDPATASPVANLLYDIKGAPAFHQAKAGRGDVGVRAVDELTLVVELEEPTGHFLSLLAHRATYPVPRHAVEAHGEAWTDVGNIVTNGPFRLEAWQRGRSMVMERNPAYHGRFEGNVQRVELSLFSSKEWPTVLAKYEADGLDVLDLLDLPPLDRDRARRRYAGEHLSAPLLSTLYVVFNVSRPPFDDARVRRAFALAIDKEWLADAVWTSYYTPATGGFVPVGMPGHSKGIGLPNDPEQARRLLAEAGYPGGRGFPTLDALMALHRVGEYLQAQWRENLGVDVAWDTMEVGAFLDRLEEDPPHLLLFAWGADYPDPDNFLRVCPARSRARWRNEAYERLVEEAWHITDQEERLPMYQQADRILVKESAIMPLLYQRLHLLVKPWVSKYPTSAIRAQFWKDVIIEPH
jgi:ABC-type oligopeptide transport system substrate-binding subunit/class 3 adenylate cyclase